MAAGIFFFEKRRDNRFSKCKFTCDFENKIVETNRNEQEAIDLSIARLRMRLDCESEAEQSSFFVII